MLYFLDITRRTGKIEDITYEIEKQDIDIKFEENMTKVEMKKECNEIEIDSKNGDFENDALGDFFIIFIFCLLYTNSYCL